MFASDDGLGYLADRRLVPQRVLRTLRHFGLSSICNVLAAIATAKLLGLGRDDAIVTVATDGAAMYPSEREKIVARDFGGGFTNLDAAAVWGEHLADVTTENAVECTAAVRNRIFNLGYFTWVEQQGTPIELFEARRDQSFWIGLRRYLGVWDDDDRRLQRGGRRRVTDAAGAVRRCLALRGVRRDGRRRHAAPVHLSALVADRPPPRAAPARRRWRPRSAPLDDPNPFVAYGPRMAWWAFGAAHGMTEAALVALAREVGDGFDGHPVQRATTSICAEARRRRCGSRTRPATSAAATRVVTSPASSCTSASPRRSASDDGRSAAAGDRLVWQRRRSPRRRWPQRAELAAAGVRPGVGAAGVLTLIESLGADIVVCPRRDDDPPGDPALLRFREAVAAGALPFTVQGPENALCLDAGRTLGWEIADAVGEPGGPAVLDRVVVQVGGGALAACVGWGLGPAVRLDTVQAQGCAPLARAWWRAKDAGYADAQLPGRWPELMTPWERPHSIADGILDDETYDWLADFAVMDGERRAPDRRPRGGDRRRRRRGRGDRHRRQRHRVGGARRPPRRRRPAGRRRDRGGDLLRRAEATAAGRTSSATP